MAKQVRRVVTGHDKQGRALVKSDIQRDLIDHPSGARTTRIWSTVRFPADNADERDGADLISTATSSSGSSFSVTEWPPKGRFSMHRTHTIDYVLVLEGELQLELEDGNAVDLKTGDIVVQRGTNHIWYNPSDRWCRIAVIMLAAEQLVIAGQPLPATLI